MKRFFIVSGILVFACLLVRMVPADVIEPGTHQVHRCVKIVNTGEFPEIVLLGYYQNLLGGGSEPVRYQVNPNECLSKGYKFNQFRIYAIRKAVLDRDGGISHVDFDNHAFATLEPYGGAVPDSVPVVSETVEYRIGKVSDTEVTLYISKRTEQYSNGAPEAVVEFTKPNL